jgi:putative salt-induced outer membrane protein
MNLRNVYIVGLLVFATPLLAAEDEEAEKSPWSGSVKLGYLATSGNTDSSSLNSGFQITYTLDLWQHEATAAAIHSTESNATTAEAYDFGWKSARNLTEHDFLFGRLDWRKDRFSSYDQQFSQAVGYGRRLIDSEAHKLNGEIGIGARQSDFIDGTDESESIVSGRLTYTWLLSETATFGQMIVIESGSSNTYSESVTELTARLIGGLALVASYTNCGFKLLKYNEKNTPFQGVFFSPKVPALFALGRGLQ